MNEAQLVATLQQEAPAETGVQQDGQHQTLAEMAELAEGFVRDNAHGEKLLKVFVEVENRLAAAGFGRRTTAKHRAQVNPDTGRYEVAAWSMWVHPDCETPFQAFLSVLMFTGRALTGRVCCKLRLLDLEGSDVLPGVLVDNDFHEVVSLAHPCAGETSQAWLARMEQAMEDLEPSDLRGILDHAVAHLDRVTTP